MRRIILAALLLAPVAALADDPATLILPTPVVAAVAQYLSQRPYAEVSQMIAALQGCVSAQAPNPPGVAVSRSECPAVTAAMAPKPSSPTPPQGTPP